jgi:signal transduction histidine kinase
VWLRVNAEWIKSPTARRVLVHWADARPAWLWSSDGEALLWRNTTARYFHGKLKKHGLKLAPEAVPIRGQIARLIRLGSVGRSSLSRIQFLAGERPVSTTCTVTPLELEDGATALLIVGVDPIEPELIEADGLDRDHIAEGFLPDGSEYLLIDEDGQVAGGSSRALDRFAPHLESEGIPELNDAGTGEISLDGETLDLTRFKASPQDAQLLLFEPPNSAPRTIDEVRSAEGIIELDTVPDVPPDYEPPAEPLLPIGLPPVELPDAEESTEDHWVEPFVEPHHEAGAGLTSLFDRLAGHDELYTNLTPDDDVFAGPLHENVGYVPAAEPTEIEAIEDPPPVEAIEPTPPPRAEPDVIAAVIEFADDEEDEPVEQPVTWRVIGRGFTPLAPEIPADAPEPAIEAAAIAEGATPDSDTVERVSRYNFDELSRILTDRVSTETPAPVEIESPIEPARKPAAESSLINLAGETFILNRLPIGIMVFRDQQVLFANRALTDLTGHDAVESLRSGGLAAIFPGEDSTAAGPVTHLVRRDGNRLPVTARLQSITWQGKPALMLSASPATDRSSHEGAVKAFAEILADAREEGFVRADRSGIITTASLHARVVLGGTAADLIGAPIGGLLDPADIAPLKEFLERPARFAETTRPSLLARGIEPNTEIVLFAEGQAGVVTGYFGLVRRKLIVTEPVNARADEDVEPSMLGRLSRGIRRPLNTIIGFSDLIRSAAFGPIDNARYLEYARDIKTAGSEIATLVDELDDFTRLKEGRYAARPADLDLGSLLESCVVRVRGQAGNARVLVRSAISERLPRIRADRASLGQAVLNLLASAIDQTPPGGSVVLSAQFEDDGSISVNVRDGGETSADLGERFVVFRDGVGKDGETLAPVRSSVGLALTRSLLAVNTCSLSVDPSGGIGTLFSMVIPADLVANG